MQASKQTNSSPRKPKKAEQSGMSAGDFRRLRDGVFELQKGDGQHFPDKNSLSLVQYGYIEREIVTREPGDGS